MRYIIGFLIGLGLIILLFVMIFRGGSNPTPATPHPLVDYSNTSTTMQFIDDFPVSADETHRQTITTVGRDQITFSVESGYQGTVLRTQSYPSNPTAYANFLQALQVAGYTKGDTAATKRDERGYCAQGHRFIFEVSDGSHNIQRLWSTSCGDIGSFHGKTTLTRELFRAQVPDYGKLTSGLGVF